MKDRLSTDPDEEGAPPAHPPQAEPSGHLRPAPIYSYFDAVARFGSIRKAAESLRIASSALNRRILDLEEEVGTSLFERLPRGVRLTEAGELYLTFVRRSLRELRQLEYQIEGLRRQQRGIVRIAAAESVTPSLLPEAMSSFRKNHPGVGFHVTVDGPERLVAALLSDNVDLILTHEPPEKHAVSVLFSASHSLSALVVPTHPLAARERVSLTDCAAFPAAIPDPTLAARGLLDRALEFLGLPLDVAFESNSIEALKTFAKLGEAVCYSFQLGKGADASGLVSLSLKEPACSEAKLYLAARRGRVLPVAAAGFAEELRETLRLHFGG